MLLRLKEGAIARLNSLNKTSTTTILIINTAVVNNHHKITAIHAILLIVA